MGNFILGSALLILTVSGFMISYLATNMVELVTGGASLLTVSLLIFSRSKSITKRKT